MLPHSINTDEGLIPFHDRIYLSLGSFLFLNSGHISYLVALPIRACMADAEVFNDYLDFFPMPLLVEYGWLYMMYRMSGQWDLLLDSTRRDSAREKIYIYQKEGRKEKVSLRKISNVQTFSPSWYDCLLFIEADSFQVEKVKDIYDF